MLQTYKWLYNLGAKHTECKILTQLEGMATFHRNQAQIAFYQKDLADYNKFMEPKMSAQQHDTAAKAFEDALHYLDPKGHPDIEKELNKFL